MKFIYLSLFTVLLAASCSSNQAAGSEDKVAITITNTQDSPLVDELIRLDAQAWKDKIPGLEHSVIKDDAGIPIPFQIIKPDDGPVVAVFTINLGPNETKTIWVEPLAEGQVVPEFKKRTQAELSYKVGGHWEDREYKDGSFQNTDYLRVPPEHTDHSWFIRYEGPGWESDKVGYRFYLDWRNATDIFGKKTGEMVLQDVGQDGFDSYHEPSGWGQDILKVGESLGIGSLAFWDGEKAARVAQTDSIICSIPVNGPVLSEVKTLYYGWDTGSQKTDVTSRLSIAAGSRLTRHDVMMSNPLPNLCTGIVRLEETTLLHDDGGKEWGYLATWGKQSLAGDNLGMAVLFRTGQLIQTTEDEHSHVAVLRPDGNTLTYYFLAAWEQEPGGISSEEAFVDYLNKEISALSTPPVVK
ncbi:MAG: DUF4861 domain-containing protein [Phaeodactylibacter sp.]|nr:DUF4861 domain-containing protein [Phaeodactylibacter sp.]MCB9274225.1 DUF4861 domain-containing protein [Lewinellaceae bacterium]